LNYLTLVNRVLNETDESEVVQGSFASATGLAKRVKNWINDVCNDLTMRSNDWAWRQALGTITTVSGTATYAVASGCDPDSIKVLYYSDTLVPLQYWDFEEFHRNYSQLSSNSSAVANQRPTIYTIFQNQFLLWPTPAAVYTIKYGYLTLHTDLALYSDSPTIPAQWQHVIIKGATAYAKKFLGDADAGSEFQLYEQQIKQMFAQNRRYVDRQPAMRGELEYYDGWDLD
jgi:hypothetical protein